MDEPRWLVDEMLGRLSRYLRFLGYDTEYVRGVTDEVILVRAREESRRLLTRDRRLATLLPDSILLTRTDIGGQMQELGQAYPSLRHEVRFDRCSVCNGRLIRIPSVPPDANRDRVPVDVLAGRTAVYTCTECSHLYWEGSHSRSVQSRLTGWRRPEVGGQ